MKSKTLNIVAFDVPYPPNYGGVIDIFYKIKSLIPRDVHVILHCFDYGRGRQAELEIYCKEVHYYKRNMNSMLLMHSLPFIAVSRRDKALVENLLKNDYPILYEGLHSCFSFSDHRLRDRKKYIRAHNIEHDYYKGLAGSTNSFWRRSYFRAEAKKLKSFERIMNDAEKVFSISPMEHKELQSRYNNVELIMPFHGNEIVADAGVREKFTLYHGNLAVAENDKAALYLVQEIFMHLDVKLLIVGNGPSKQLKESVKGRKNVEIKSGLNTEEIQGLIFKCHINILPTFQSTGIKLKLINALYNGGHCLVNKPMVEGTGLETLCHVSNSPEHMRSTIGHLMNVEYSENERARRSKVLLGKLSDQTNAMQLIEHIFGSH